MTQYFDRSFVLRVMPVKILRLYTLLFSLSSITLSLSAQTGGNSVFKFLDIPVSARQSAYGGKMVPVKDNDFSTILGNPSLLSEKMNNNVGFTYVNYLADVNFFYAAYSHHYDKIGSFATSIQALSYGKFKGADATGLTTGTFTAADYCYNIQYARQVKDSIISVGATFKTIYSHLDQYTSLGNAIDLGATYLTRNKYLTITVLVKNFGYQWKPYTEGNREPMPFDIQTGISYKLPKAPIRFFSVDHSNNIKDLTYEDPANPTQTLDPLTGKAIKQNKFKKWADKEARHEIIGIEILPGKNFNIQFSYNYRRRQELKFAGRAGLAGFSFGFGVKISKFSISYSHAQFNTAAGTDHITITTNLSSFHSKK